MELYGFQSKASLDIASKFKDYMENPLMRTRDEIVPFFQNLSAITGGGKTLILADTIAQMRMQVAVEPIVLWISKGKVVVSQTYNNLYAGKYSDFISGFDVMPLLDCKAEKIETNDMALLLVATVGKFNQRDMDKGDRMVYRVNLDNADISLWDMLKHRQTSNGVKRPLFVVYDEGHNLSDQQTEILLKLNPDAILSASATMRVPDLLHKRVMQRIIDDKDWTVADFSVIVKSADVVKCGLIKKNISFNGHVAPMEMTIDDMMGDYKQLSSYISENHIAFQPKAIYVSNTNIVAETGEKDNHLLPFDDRQSRPIRIWKHLVEKHGIDPDDIAIYCDLKVDARFPVPDNFHIFSGGESDYDQFMSQEYHHIIFNLSLQEGWDDPQCYFAYIDKDMGSKDQVTQVLGRVLRQPNAKHFPNTDLNTAHVYVRADSKRVIDGAIEEIQAKLASETPEVTLTIFKGKSSDKSDSKLSPKKAMKLPLTTIDAANAMQPIRNIIERIPDFRNDSNNTIGTGSQIKVLQSIGEGINQKSEWVTTTHTNRITARWLFKRELQKYFPNVMNLCDTENDLFDALIEYYSKAADIIKEKAEDVVDAYIEHSIIVQDATNTFVVPDVYVDPKNKQTFDNALHGAYSDFNQFELEFALALDKSSKAKTWFRNPKQGCFSIPLLDKGDTNNFNPDFIVWHSNKIVAIDTKGDHLINNDASRKLFYLEKYGKGADLFIILITRGEWSKEIKKVGPSGYTVWELKNGKIRGHHTLSIVDCVSLCLSIL